MSRLKQAVRRWNQGDEGNERMTEQMRGKTSVNDGAYFPPAGRWIALSKKRKKNLKIALLLCMHAQIWSLYETKGTHEGHFITRHATPMCTKIDHKSSSKELCLILKCGSRNKNATVAEMWMELDEWQDPQDLFFRRGNSMNKPIADVGKHKEAEWMTKRRQQNESYVQFQEPGRARWKVDGLRKDVKSVGNWADEGDIWSLETRVWCVRGRWSWKQM